MFRLAYSSGEVLEQGFSSSGDFPIAIRTPLDGALISKTLHLTAITTASNKLFISATTKIPELGRVKQTVQLRSDSFVKNFIVVNQLALFSFAFGFENARRANRGSDGGGLQHWKNVTLLLSSQVK